ncbi:hypothetical protein ABIA69_000179 [Lysinibacillus parviboronicapiens]|uniref:DUF2339 domain-containing protein n=1 Tax=Lysinibacillus parviboronicapiens TaxID=436516 RepID=A0ABV2PDM4_9BACI
MSLELEQRIAKLEKEVVDLRQEVDALKQSPAVDKTSTLNARKSMLEQTSPTPTPNPRPMPVHEKTVQPQRSLEERIMWALPKVFMVILVLGVLWGLKLVSDYGYLSNEVKIILAYILSISLAVIAYVIEVKKFGSSAIMISLYGGAFIIGILTTAAGAILYEVLGLTMALIIAVIFIGYGITISYFKKNEVLTLFVAFTSLLLPYLLEYMDFSSVIILIFVIVLFSMLQFVILQHKQKIALYVATFFTVLAVSVVAFMNSDNQVVFAIGMLIVLALYFMSWCRLYNPESTWKHLHVGMQFSLGTFSLLLMNLIIRNVDYNELLLIVLLSLFVAVASYGYKQKWQEAFDSAVTLAFITLCNTLLIMNMPDKVDDLLLPLMTFAGVMISLRLRVSMMKVVSSLFFTIALFVSYTVHEPTPFFSIAHVSLLMPGVYLIVIYLYALRPKETLNTFEKLMKDMYVLDLLAVITTGYILAYVGKLDTAYFAGVSEIPHSMFILLALIFALSLLLPVKWKGRALTPVLGVFFLFFTLLLTVLPYNMQGIEWINLATRLVYMAVIVAIVIDLLMKGRIYQLYEERMAKFLDTTVSAGVVLVMLAIWGFVYQLAYNSLLDWKLSIALSTMTLFLTASISLWLSSVHHLRKLRLTGFAVLAIAFIKLIFLDLSALDLLIRAILFITIGGIGMLLSGRLLRK